MSLLQALLLDPVRIHVWIAKRSDGAAGTGTQSDPFDGGTLTKFDTVMSGLAANTCVHIGPGEFETAGYYNGLTGSGWQVKPGMRIVGSGIDATRLKLNNTTATTQAVYAIAHALTGTTVDFFEVCDLSIDCGFNLLGGSTSTAGAVRIMGNHSRAVRLKVTNWGAKSAGNPGYVVAMLTGDPTVGVTGVLNCGIEECIAVQPNGSSVGGTVALHVGGKEGVDGTLEAFGIGPYIRNCFVDCGQVSDFTKDFRGMSMAWCRGGVVEGNEVHNTRLAGPFQIGTGARDLVIRHNLYRNVQVGPYWNLTSQGVEQLAIEANSIELGTGGTDSEYAIHLFTSSTPPAYLYGNILIRNNRIRYVDGATGSRNGIRVVNARNLIMRENVLDVSPSAPERPLTIKDCESVEFFNNTTAAGVLIRGYNEATGVLYGELEVDAEDALILSLLK